MLFNPGQVYTTRIAMLFCQENQVDVIGLLRKHLKGDWGDLTEDDKKANAMAVYSGDRIVSAYNVLEGRQKIYVITEHDRSMTTIMLAEEY